MLERPSMVDFPGRLACVLFTTGCNFSCGFCHNAPLLGERKPGLTWERLDSACREFRQSWVRGAVVTGGEPTLWRSLPQLLEFLSGHGFQLKLDTNGSRPADLERVLERLDYVAMDVKCSLARYEGFVRFAAPR
jgi:pyruvate formate lyase activating enzyme